MTRSERDAAWLHGAFFLASAAVVVPLVGAPSSGSAAGRAIGWAIAALVVGYHLALLTVALRRRHHEWLDLWTFVAPLSIVQVLPDAFLAGVLGVLEFPLAFPRIGAVSAFMAGMWAIPLFLILLVGRGVEARRGVGAAAGAVLAASFVLFVGSEAILTRVPVWRARDVAHVGPVALYVVLPELLLGLAAWWTHRTLPRAATLRRLLAAPLLSLLYLGALAASFLFLGETLAGATLAGATLAAGL